MTARARLVLTLSRKCARPKISRCAAWKRAGCILVKKCHAQPSITVLGGFRPFARVSRVQKKVKKAPVRPQDYMFDE